jgi:hypothetical protein
MRPSKADPKATPPPMSCPCRRELRLHCHCAPHPRCSTAQLDAIKGVATYSKARLNVNAAAGRHAAQPR